MVLWRSISGRDSIKKCSIGQNIARITPIEIANQTPFSWVIGPEKRIKKGGSSKNEGLVSSMFWNVLNIGLTRDYCFKRSSTLDNFFMVFDCKGIRAIRVSMLWWLWLKLHWARQSGSNKCERMHPLAQFHFQYQLLFKEQFSQFWKIPTPIIWPTSDISA